MAMPTVSDLLLPLLELASDQHEHSVRAATHDLANTLSLSAEEIALCMADGQHLTFDNRVGWARTYLKKAGLLVYPRQGYFQITSRGIDVLRSKPAKINTRLLYQFPEFRDFHAGSTQEPDTL
jgi:restriction system protein